MEKKIDKWVTRLVTNPPDVLVGANCAWGGVRNHIHAIGRCSSLNVALAPSEDLLQQVGAERIAPLLSESLLRHQANRIKVVHSHVFPWFINWCQMQQKEGVRWVHSHHNWYYPEFAVDGLESWQNEFNEGFLVALRNADVCLSVSRHQQTFLKESFEIETQYLPNGVDIEMCDAANAKRFIKKTGFENFVLYVGRNDPVKNPIDFVRLARELPDHQFVMIGGDLSDKSLHIDWHVESPENLAVIGPVTQAEVQDAIAACSALVVTSKREGLPTLVMEGMAQRKAVVVPDEKGCMEVIGNDEVGFVYKQGEIEDLAQKVLDAMADKKLGELARKRVLAEYDWRVIAPKLDAIYQGELN